MKPAAYRVVSAEARGYRDAVTRLWAEGLEGLVGETARTKFERFYASSPLRPPQVLMLLTEPAGEAVGTQGLIPRSFAVGDDAFACATLADFVVRPEHRSLGPALQLIKAATSLCGRELSLLYGTPNRKAEPLLRRAGFRPLGELTRYTRLARSKGYLSARMPRIVAILLAVPADLLIGAIDSVRGLRTHALTWTEASAFGPEVDELWSRRDREVLMAERSSRTLAWRFSVSASSNGHRLALARNRLGEVAGYVVWHRHADTAFICDFLASHLEKAAAPLLDSFARYAKRLGVERVSLEVMGGARLDQGLRSSGFTTRERSRVYGMASEALQRHIDARAMFMTGFDRDNAE